MKYTAEQMFDLLVVAQDMFAHSFWGSAKSEIKIRNEWDNLTVLLRTEIFSDNGSITVYHAKKHGNETLKKCSIYRPGQWIKHLEDEIVKVSRKEAAEKRLKRMSLMTCFEPIDDAFIFNGKAKQTSERQPQNTLGELAELIHSIIEDAVNDHM